MSDGARAHQLQCAEFLERHSEFLDERMPGTERQRFAAHVSECGSCGRYDSVVRRGRELLCELPAIDTSERFDLRLQHRLLHEEEARRATAARSRVGVAAALVFAGTIAAIGWSPTLRESLRTTVAAVGGSRAEPGSEARPTAERLLDVHRPSGPLFTASLLNSTGPAAPLFAADPSSLGLRPGPYSPLIVMPPAQRVGTSAFPRLAE